MSLGKTQEGGASHGRLCSQGTTEQPGRAPETSLVPPAQGLGALGDQLNFHLCPCY